MSTLTTPHDAHVEAAMLRHDLAAARRKLAEAEAQSFANVIDRLAQAGALRVWIESADQLTPGGSPRWHVRVEGWDQDDSRWSWAEVDRDVVGMLAEAIEAVTR